jgi:hypothetical protein
MILQCKPLVFHNMWGDAAILDEWQQLAALTDCPKLD